MVTLSDGFLAHCSCWLPGSARVSPDPLQGGQANRHFARQPPAVCATAFHQKRRLSPLPKPRAISPINQYFRVLGKILATAWHEPDLIYHHLSALRAGPVLFPSWERDWRAHCHTRATPGLRACLRS